MTEQWIEVVKEAMKLPALLPEIYGDLLKPGVKQAGLALETVLGLCNMILSPITWANERTRIALKGNLEKYRAKIEHLPEEKVAVVPPEIGVPIMEKLVYVTDEELSDLYINLLATASCVDTAHFAHPGFVNVINNLSPDEALVLKEIHRHGALAFLTAKRDVKLFLSDKETKGSLLIGDLLTGVETKIRLLFPENMNAYFSNLEGLGLIRIRPNWSLVHFEVQYKSLETFYRSAFEDHDDDGEEEPLRFERGRIEFTPFGELFMDACLTKVDHG